jgi:hypothetical protein
MAFTQKVLRFTFSGAKAGDLSAAGLRASASIQSYPDRAGTVAQVKIWGLTLDQMNAYSSVIPALVAAEQFNLVIEAGDLGKQLVQLLNGPILRSYIDLSGAPDSAFNVTMIDTFLAATPITSQSKSGASDAADLIANICAASNLTFDNTAGAHGVLNNQTTYGSAIDQIARIATAAKFNWKLNGKTLSIWPHNGTVDDVVIDVGPNTDPPMVNYPGYWEAGLVVTSQFNQEVQIGRQMNVVGSSIPKANGKWQIIQVHHDLTTMLAKGPWFTTAILAAINP